MLLTNPDPEQTKNPPTAQRAWQHPAHGSAGHFEALSGGWGSDARPRWTWCAAGSLGRPSETLAPVRPSTKQITEVLAWVHYGSLWFTVVHYGSLLLVCWLVGCDPYHRL